MTRKLKTRLGIVLLAAGLSVPCQGEIIERELGTDANGNVVTGYVFQAGSSFRRSSRSTSSLRPRRVYRPSRGIVRGGWGYGYGYRYGYACLPACWGPSVPFHCATPLGGSHLSIWHGATSRVSFTVFR